MFHFSGRHRLWAFAQMAFARRLMRGLEGLQFYRLLGMGRGIGFSLEPDWTRYAVLSVWESEHGARRFLETSRLMQRYRNRAERSATVILRTRQAHGSWSGVNPFLPAVPANEPGGESGDDVAVAVLTRASIRVSQLRAFWSQVDPVRRVLEGADGLRASVGIGELPFLRQATFSIWESTEQMRRFAYRSPEHRQAIARTKAENWYGEDLFARFEIIEQIGIFP